MRLPLEMETQGSSITVGGGVKNPGGVPGSGLADFHTRVTQDRLAIAVPAIDLFDDKVISLGFDRHHDDRIQW